MAFLTMAAATIGAGVIAGGASIAGSIISKNAADANTRAQIDAAAERQEKEIQERRRIEGELKAIAVKSPNEIKAIDSLIKQKERILLQNERSIAKTRELLDTFDPAVKEAGTQLYQTLQGEQSKMLDPIMKQRDRQKKLLEANLARTMGPGWRTSSAGIEAITRFDQQTYEAAANVQFQTLNQLTQVASTGMATRNQGEALIQDLFRTGISADQAILTAEHNVKAREMGALTGAASVAPINFGAMQEAAKSVGQGDAMVGSAVSSFGNQILGVGANLAGQQLGHQQTMETLKTLGYGPKQDSSVVGGTLKPTDASNSFGNLFG